jgi:hypothetical protein
MSETSPLNNSKILPCELPDTDLRYSTGFPIQWQPPLELRSSFGLTLPPRAGVLVPKTHTFSGNTPRLAWFSHRGIMIKLMQLYQRICSFPHPPRRCSTLRSEFDSGVESSTRRHSSRRSATPERGASAALVTFTFELPEIARFLLSKINMFPCTDNISINFEPIGGEYAGG